MCSSSVVKHCGGERGRLAGCKAQMNLWSVWLVSNTNLLRQVLRWPRANVFLPLRGMCLTLHSSPYWQMRKPVFHLYKCTWAWKRHVDLGNTKDNGGTRERKGPVGLCQVKQREPRCWTVARKGNESQIWLKNYRAVSKLKHSTWKMQVTKEIESNKGNNLGGRAGNLMPTHIYSTINYIHIHTWIPLHSYLFISSIPHL